MTSEPAQKKLYSCIDAGLSAPQSLQHLAIREYTKKIGAGVMFYSSEEKKTLKSQAFIRAKLKRSTDIDGIVFFSVHQFRYNPEFDWKLLRDILRDGYEAHFAREGVSLRSEADLDRTFSFLFSVDFTLRRDQSAQWRSMVETLSPETIKELSLSRRC